MPELYASPGDGAVPPSQKERRPPFTTDPSVQRPNLADLKAGQVRVAKRSFLYRRWGIPKQQTAAGGTDKHVNRAFYDDAYAARWAADGTPPPLDIVIRDLPPSAVFVPLRGDTDTSRVYVPETAPPGPPPDTAENLLARTRALARAFEAAASELNAMADRLEAMMGAPNREK